jgi:mannose-1-phosphate guanylyltransferase/mannose-6-phosphate isomerase
MTKAENKIVPIILSGGSGTRLWPLSREAHPKQFFRLLNPDASLMQETMARVSNPSRFTAPIVIGNHQHRFLIAEQLREAGIESPEILIEPRARNTAPAIAAAALYVQQRYGNAPLLVLPTDQAIANVEEFLAKVELAASLADDYLVTFGIRPDYPETGYGYIQRGSAIGKTAGLYQVAAFAEKPDAKTAQSYIDGGIHDWNSGMFLFSPKLLLSEMEQFQPELLTHCQMAVENRQSDLDFIRLDEESFAKAPSISIDYGIMEHTKHAAVVPLDCGWSDTGSWDAMWRIAPKDEQGNVRVGETYQIDTANCYIRSEEGPAIATIGIDNLTIVATRDAVLVADTSRAQELKGLIAQVRELNPELLSQNSRVYRPWGMYQSVNSGERYQVKHIHVKPGAKLSLQMHYHRAEHWVVVSGTAKVTIDDKEVILAENQSIYIPHGSVHRIENPGKVALEIIEVQSGAYLGEDDIVRFEDQYGRAGEK